MLLLFDIDGTLVHRASAEHAEALHDALLAVHGIDTRIKHVAFEAAGRTDAEIARVILRGHDVDDATIAARAAAVIVAAGDAYARRVPESLADKQVPGIAALVEELASRDDVVLSLVTGNFERIAHLKLRAAGLGAFFTEGQGGFGSDSEHRAELPPLARARAGTTDTPHPAQRTLVIGDTPRDIACARADGVGVLAVTTGPHPAEDLHGADAVCADAGELRAAILARV